MVLPAKEFLEEKKVKYLYPGVELIFDSSSGDLLEVNTNKGTMRIDSCYLDIGIESPDPEQVQNLKTHGKYIRDSLGFYNFDCVDVLSNTRRPITGEIPRHYEFTPENKKDPESVIFEHDSDKITVSYDTETYNTFKLRVKTEYEIRGNVICISSAVSNIGDKLFVLNGAAYVLHGMLLSSSAVFEMPGSTPCGIHSISEIPDGQSVKTDAPSPFVHYCDNGHHTNVIFVNPFEKWTTGIYKLEKGGNKITQINLSCTIAQIKPDQVIEIGKQYIQILGADDPYNAVSELYAEEGWIAPSDGRCATAIYTCHPAGTSDNDFRNPDGSNQTGTLETMAEYLPKIADMGIDNIWIMPVFVHPENTGTLYLPYNMEHIDNRYSRVGNGDQTMKAYIDAASKLGIHVMFDYVPHGPCMYKPNFDDGLYDNPWLTQERLTWIGTDRDGNYGIEWNCYSLDYSNPDYLSYMESLAKKHTEEFGISGARIDVCIGSLPNWSPVKDHRISQSGLYGGAVMAKAIRDGIIKGGQKPLIYPEIAFVLPFYAPYMDLVYDFPFYRMTRELRLKKVDEITFASSVAHWLDAEIRSAPKGMKFGRFLENSDTVSSWYPQAFDCSRAVDVYGTDKARALWVLLATIDGTFVIYQNDELGNEVFFKELLDMRKKHLGPQYGIEHFPCDGSGVIAYRRYLGDNQKLILINLTSTEQTRDFGGIDIGEISFISAKKKILYGKEAHFNIFGGEVSLLPYSCIVIELNS